MKHFDDRLRAYAGLLLLLYILREQCGWQEGLLPQLCYNSFSKPVLKDLAIDFNISHSGEMVACSCISGGRTGMDIEEMSPVEIADYDMVFSEEEMSLIRSGPEPLREFYRLWTYKEAITKASEAGFLLDPLQITFENNRSVVAKKEWFLFDLPLAGEYAGSVAFDCPENPLVMYVPWKKLAGICKDQVHEAF